MKIYVLLKQVPDTETRIKIAGDKKSIDVGGIKWIISPFDEHAIEEALRIREKTGGSVTAVSLGPDRVVEALRTAYAMGVDQAFHIKDDSYNELDVGYTAAVLASFLKEEAPDLILTGHTAIDSQSSMVPVMIAGHLDIPAVINTLELKVEGSDVDAKREIQGGSAHIRAKLPLVVTAGKGLNEPRYPSLKGIMAAKKKKAEVREASSYNVSVQKIEVVSMELPPPRPPGRVIEGGSAAEKAAELARLLREEARVI